MRGRVEHNNNNNKKVCGMLNEDIAMSAIAVKKIIYWKVNLKFVSLSSLHLHRPKNT